MGRSEARSDVAHAVKRITFGCGPLAVACASSEPAAADWLAEFFAPWFTAIEQPADWSVRLTGAAELYRDLLRRWSADAAPVPCFALDQQTASHPGRTRNGGVEVVDPERSCVFRIAPSEVDLVADPATRRWRFAAMRIIREIAVTRLRRTELELHAAAIERAGRAVLLCGPKLSGKTTLLMHLLRAARCRLIANDHVFVGAPAAASDALFHVRGVPTAVRIRPDTVARFPAVARGLPHVALPYLFTRAELDEARDEPEPITSGELSLTLGQFARQLGVEASPGAALAALIFPEISDAEPCSSLRRLSPSVVERRIRANLFARGMSGRPRTPFDELDGVEPSPGPALASAVAARVPGFRVVLGRKAYDDPASAIRLLDAVLAP